MLRGPVFGGWISLLPPEVGEERGLRFTDLFITLAEGRKRGGESAVLSPQAREPRGPEDHLAGHVVEIVRDRLDVVHVPVVDGCITIDIP